MSKSLLTLPSHPVELYSKFSTYKQVRNQVKKQSHGEHFQKHAIIFGLAWVTGDSATFLTACTGEGELIVWKVPVVQGDTQPIFRYEHSFRRARTKSRQPLIVTLGALEIKKTNQSHHFSNILQM